MRAENHKLLNVTQQNCVISNGGSLDLLEITPVFLLYQFSGFASTNALIEVDFFLSYSC